MNKRTSFFIKQNFEEEVSHLLQQIEEKENKFKEGLTKEKFSFFKESKSLELQCLGYGLFNQNEALTNYESFLDKITNQLLKEQVNFSLTVTINGFDFKQAEKSLFLTNLKEKIQKLKPKLQGLSIQTSNLQNVTATNFQEFLSLALNNNKQFRKFNLQCSNWNFVDNKRPTYGQVQGLFEKFNKQAQKNPLSITKFRLELSAWYHKFEQALNFLKFTDKPQDMIKDKQSKDQKQQYEESKFSSKIQSLFFNGMEKLLRQLFQGLPDLEQFELDLRNNHQVLKLKNLKKKLDTMNIKDHVQPTNVVQSSLSSILKMNNMEKQDQKDKKKAVTINYIV